MRYILHLRAHVAALAQYCNLPDRYDMTCATNESFLRILYEN